MLDITAYLLLNEAEVHCKDMRLAQGHWLVWLHSPGVQRLHVGVESRERRTIHQLGVFGEVHFSSHPPSAYFQIR